MIFKKLLGVFVGSYENTTFLKISCTKKLKSICLQCLLTFSFNEVFINILMSLGKKKLSIPYIFL